MADISHISSLEREETLQKIPKYEKALDSLNPEFKELIEIMYMNDFELEQLGVLTIALHSLELHQQHRGCIGIGKLLDMDNSHIQAVIEANCISKFIEFIKQSDHPILQLEATTCLKCIAAGTTDEAKLIVVIGLLDLIQSLVSILIFVHFLVILQDEGVIPIFCDLIQSPYLDIQDQAIQAIGNLLGDLCEYRDMILEEGVTKLLANILLTATNQNIIKHGSMALCNLCRLKPLPPFYLIQDAIIPLSKILKDQTDSESLSSAAWAFTYLSDGDEARIQLVIDSGVVPTLIKHINHPVVSIFLPCMRTIGNICLGSDLQIDQVINNGALPKVFQKTKHQKEIVRKESFWVLSNIAAGNSEQISQIVNESYFVNTLFTGLLNDSEIVSREAAWVICNCTSEAFPKDIKKLVDMKIIDVYSEMLKTSQDKRIIELILGSLKCILICGEKHFQVGKSNLFTLELKQLEVIAVIEELQKHSDNNVSKVSLFLSQNFFKFDNGDAMIIE